tara:strand:+ start:1417 stop:2673 length:1257 start_codon:yes stop_codon:yes gene_type:complete
MSGNAAEMHGKLEVLRDTVRRIVVDSQTNNPYELGAWTYVSRFLYYVLDLSPESLAYIRLHTEIFNGEPVNKLIFSNSASEQSFINTHGYDAILKDLPDDLILEEPKLPEFRHSLFADHPPPFAGQPVPLGQAVSGRQLTPDLMRYQLYVRNLYQLGFIEKMANAQPNDRFVFLEIGTGFGCLQYQLLSRFKNKMSAIVIDLPLMLIFTGAYVVANMPDVNVYLFDPDKPDIKPDPTVHDLILIPNYRVDILEDIEKVDLAFNSISMQEMDPKQITDYLEFLHRKVRGGFYYHGSMTLYEGDDPGTIDNVVGEIAEKFDIRPSLELFRKTAASYVSSSLVSWPINLPYQFIAVPSESTWKPPEDAQMRVTLVDYRQVDVKLSDGTGNGEVEQFTVASRPSIAMRIARKLRNLVKRTLS